MNNKQILSYIIIFAVAIVGIFIVKDMVIQPSTSPSPSISPTPSPTSSASPTTSPVGNVVPKCWLTGEIVYDGSVFMHSGAQEFNYKDMDDPHDIINWVLSPSGETFSIGPNRASGLKLPKGSDYLTVSFEGLNPKYDKYELTASIDYVAVIDNAAKILNEKCSGKTTLIIDK